MYLVFMYVLPFGGLSVLNSLMYLDVRRSNARQSTMSSNEKSEMRLAVMLMTVVVVFQICNILPLIVNILEGFGKAIEGVTQVSNMLVTLNSSLNVFIYIIMGEKFKRAFLQILAGSGCHCMVKLMGGTNGAPENTVVTQSRRPTAIQPDFQMRPSVVRLNVQGDPEVAASTAATTEKSRLQRLGRMFSLKKQKTDPNRLAPVKYLGVNG